MAAKLKFVLLDLDDTLFDSHGFARKARIAALRAMKKEGMRASIAKAYKTLVEVVREHGANDTDHFGKLLVKLGEGRNARMIAAGIRAYHQEKQGIRAFADARKAIAKLKRAGLKVYVATEGKAVKQWDKLVRLGLQNDVEGALISEELGADKGTGFYLCALRVLRAEPSSVLMVGDKPGRDYFPARKEGIRTLLVLRSKEAVAAAVKAGARKQDIVKNLGSAAARALKVLKNGS